MTKEPLDLKYLLTIQLPEPKPGDLVESVISWAERCPDQLADLLRAHSKWLARYAEEVTRAEAERGRLFLASLTEEQAHRYLDACATARAQVAARIAGRRPRSKRRHS